MTAVQVFGVITLALCWAVLGGVVYAYQHPAMDVRWLLRLRLTACLFGGLTVMSVAVTELTWQEATALGEVALLLLVVAMLIGYGIVAGSGYWPELRRYLGRLVRDGFCWLTDIRESVAWWRFSRWYARTDRKRPTTRKASR